MGGGGQSQTTNESSSTRYAPWVEQAAQSIFGRAQGIADRPYEVLQHPVVSNLQPIWYTARGQLKSLDDYYKNYDAATKGYQGAIDYDPTNIDPSKYTAAQLAGTDLSQYLNPYIQNVENRAVDTMTRAGQTGLRDLASDATRKGAFGGSRAALQGAVQQAEVTRGIGDMSANLRKQGYDTATANALKDVAARNQQMEKVGDWRQQAQIESEKNKLIDQQNAIQASQGLTSTADSYQQAAMNKMMAYLGFGQMQQEQQQRYYDNRRDAFERFRNYPLENLSVLMAALQGMGPFGGMFKQGTSTSKTSGGGGMQSMLGMIPGIAQLGAGLSDRTTKTNIEPVGKAGKTALYAFDYRHDVEEAKRTGKPLPPKRVGPMADEVPSVKLKGSRKVKGRRIVDLTGIPV